MTKTLTILTTVALMAFGSAAYAEHSGNEEGAGWKSLSDTEKLQRIEQRRTAYRQKLDDKWDAMSDDEKIKYAERKMGNHKGKIREHHQEQQLGE